jgi:hypothetical protein
MKETVPTWNTTSSANDDPPTLNDTTRANESLLGEDLSSPADSDSTGRAPLLTEAEIQAIIIAQATHPNGASHENTEKIVKWVGRARIEQAICELLFQGHFSVFVREDGELVWVAREHALMALEQAMQCPCWKPEEGTYHVTEKFLNQSTSR